MLKTQSQPKSTAPTPTPATKPRATTLTTENALSGLLPPETRFSTGVIEALVAPRPVPSHQASVAIKGCILLHGPRAIRKYSNDLENDNERLELQRLKAVTDPRAAVPIPHQREPEKTTDLDHGDYGDLGGSRHHSGHSLGDETDDNIDDRHVQPNYDKGKKPVHKANTAQDAEEPGDTRSGFRFDDPAGRGSQQCEGSNRKDNGGVSPLLSVPIDGPEKDSPTGVDTIGADMAPSLSILKEDHSASKKRKSQVATDQRPEVGTTDGSEQQSPTKRARHSGQGKAEEAQQPPVLRSEPMDQARLTSSAEQMSRKGHLAKKGDHRVEDSVKGGPTQSVGTSSMYSPSEYEKIYEIAGFR